MRWGVVAAVWLVLAGSQPAHARAPSPERFHTQVTELYGTISPNADRAAKERYARKADALWEAAQEDPDGYLPLLRAELGRSDAPDLFLLDGSVLFVRLTTAPEDLELVNGVLTRVDFAKVDGAVYVSLVNALGLEGIDTRAAALRLLDHPADEMIADTGIHVAFLSRTQYVAFALFPNGGDFLPDLVAALGTADEPDRLSALIDLVWAVQTPASHAALAAFAADAAKPEDARDYARRGLDHKADDPPTASLDELVARRRLALGNPFRDGAFAQFHELTDDIAWIRAAEREDPPAGS